MISYKLFNKISFYNFLKGKYVYTGSGKRNLDARLRRHFLKEKNTDIHIEMLINWSNESPTGSPTGGFIPYLDVLATIKNKDGKSMKVKLTPHLNITDNFHYAQNIQLPGKIEDLYEVTIEIIPPKNGQLGIHFDWNQNYGFLVEKQKFIYTDLSFEDIAKQSRR